MKIMFKNNQTIEVTSVRESFGWEKEEMNILQLGFNKELSTVESFEALKECINKDNIQEIKCFNANNEMIATYRCRDIASFNSVLTETEYQINCSLILV